MAEKPTYNELEQRVQELEQKNNRFKRCEEALHRGKEEYHSIFNAARDAFLIFDCAGNIIEANLQACEMYGYPLKEMLTLSRTS